MYKKIIIITNMIIIITAITFFDFSKKDETISLFNQEYNIYLNKLDFSNIDINSDNTWYEKLAFFPNLEEVNLGLNKVYSSDIKKIKDLYPNIGFNYLTTYKIYNMDIREDIEYLDLSKSLIDGNILTYFTYFPKLKKVEFGNQKIDKNIIIQLIKNYPNIDFNYLININNKYYNSNITDLNLKGEIIESYDEFKELLIAFPKLKTLDMSDTNLTNEQLGSLREIYPNITIDWILYFGRWSVKTDAVAFSVLITDTRRPRLDTKEASILKYCRNLQALDLGHQALDDISFIGKYLKELRVLILADNKITDITPLKNLKKLHYLELFMNKITDISPLQGLDSLVDLNICHNYHLSNIDALTNMKKLERLWINNTSVNTTSVNILKNNMPNLKVNMTSLKSTDGGWRAHNRYYSLIDMFNKQSYISEEFTKYD